VKSSLTMIPMEKEAATVQSKRMSRDCSSPHEVYGSKAQVVALTRSAGSHNNPGCKQRHREVGEPLDATKANPAAMAARMSQSVITKCAGYGDTRKCLSIRSPAATLA
jgi:hypothetical protein